jgi:hypothetical protein
MNPRRITLAALTLALLLVPAQAALAKELGRVVISGPGLKTPIEITDPEVANRFGLALLDNLDKQRIDAPKSPGEDFYTIDRGFRDQKGTIVGYDHVRFYPDPATGRGWFRFMGTDGYESEYNGAWFQPSPAGEEAVLAVLADHGVTFKSPEETAGKTDLAAVSEAHKTDAADAAAAPAQAESAAVPVQPDSPATNLSLIVGGAVVLMLVVAVGAALARMRAKKADA